MVVSQNQENCEQACCTFDRMDKESNGWWDLRLEALHKPRYDGDDVTVMRGKHKVRGWLRWLFRNYSHPPYLTHPFLSLSLSSTATANWKAMAAEISWQERERHFALVGSGKSFLSLLSNIPTQYLTSLHSHGLWYCTTPPLLLLSLLCCSVSASHGSSAWRLNPAN